MTDVRQASMRDLDGLVPLFDAYRQFYGQVADLERARDFLTQRMERAESVILVAADVGKLVGFTQLYASFSSTRTARIYILNDLYVASSHRRAGVGRALLDAAAAYAKNAGAVRLALSTAHTNLAAQRLYESLGWKLDEQFRTYQLAIAS